MSPPLRCSRHLWELCWRVSHSTPRRHDVPSVYAAVLVPHTCSALSINPVFQICHLVEGDSSTGSSADEAMLGMLSEGRASLS